MFDHCSGCRRSHPLGLRGMSAAFALHAAAVLLVGRKGPQPARAPAATVVAVDSFILAPVPSSPVAGRPPGVSAPARPDLPGVPIRELPILEPAVPGVPGPAVDPRRLISGYGLSSLDSVLRTGGFQATGAADPESIPPSVLFQAPSTYPVRLSAGRIEGRVLLDFVIDPLGNVEPGSIVVVTSTDTGFVGAAYDAVLRSRFRPGSVAGHPVRSLVRQVVVFHIEP